MTEERGIAAGKSSGTVCESASRLCDRQNALDGLIHVEVYRSGELIDVVHEHNMIMTQGRINLAKLLSGETGLHVSHAGVGTGNFPPTPDDVGLADQVLVPISSIEFPSTRTVKFNFTVGRDEAVGLDLYEFGLFCADGSMFSHRVRGAVLPKSDDMELKSYWVIQF